jgi:hypothetical protein
MSPVLSVISIVIISKVILSIVVASGTLKDTILGTFSCQNCQLSPVFPSANVVKLFTS